MWEFFSAKVECYTFTSMIPHLSLLLKHKKKILWATIIFWLLIGGFIFVTTIISENYFGAKPLDIVEIKQYGIRMILWFFLTPLIVLVGLKFNIEDYKIPWFITIHIIFGTLILILEFFLETSIIKPIAENYYHRLILWSELITPFVNKYLGYILSYFLLIGMVNIFVYFTSLNVARNELFLKKIQNKNLKYEVTLAELKSLKSQIQPHFLFNAHQSIIGLVLKNQNDKAIEMLNKLSDLLRYTLTSQDQQMVSLEEELKIILMYLDIQKVRFQDRFSYIQNIEKQTLPFEIPHLILQPIIENSVKYGVEKSEDKTEIKISSYFSEKFLIIEIENSGNFENKPENQGLGIGLQNVRKRLEQYYDNTAMLDFKIKRNLAITTIKIPR